MSDAQPGAAHVRASMKTKVSLTMPPHVLTFLTLPAKAHFFSRQE